jgi:alcohol dehydrogenase (NADP+)
MSASSETTSFDDSIDHEAVLAALPPPTPTQAAYGWSRDWTAAWASHERLLLEARGASLETLERAFAYEPSACERENGGARIQYFDLTGGPVVRLAKRRAIEEQIAHEERAIDERRLASRPPLPRSLPDQPRATLASGFAIPLLGLGTWKSEPGAVRLAVEAALKCGYRHVDCASVYENESEVGEALDAVLGHYKLSRRDVFVTSKLWNTDHAPERVRVACEKTLRDLKLNYLDLYLIHWPVVTGCVGEALSPSIRETWEAMEALVDEGLVRSIGVSNFSAAKMDAIRAYARHPISVCQVECHPFWPQRKLAEYCADNDIHFTAYSPLGSPDSASMFRRDEVRAPALLKDPTVARVAERVGRDVGQVLIKWALQKRPGSSALPKSADPKRVESNLSVIAEEWALSDEDLAELDALAERTRYRAVDGAFWLNPAGPYRTLKDLWDED